MKIVQFFANHWKWIIGLSVAILIAIFQYSQTVDKKELTIVFKESHGLLNSNNAGLKISYLEKKLSNPYQKEVLITNTGDVPLTKSDFQNDLEFTWDEYDKLFSFNLKDSDPEEMGLKIEFNKRRASVQPFLLNPNEFITFSFLYDRRIGDISLKTTIRLADFEVVEGDYDTDDEKDFSWIFFVGGILLTISLTLFTKVSMDIENIELLNKQMINISFLLLLIAYIIYYILSMVYFIDRSHHVMWILWILMPVGIQAIVNSIVKHLKQNIETEEIE